MPPNKRPNPLIDKAPGLQRVRHLLAVSSCKGGVGKSTVAVNLAYALHGQGMKVGLFDADVYGPSLPTIVRPRSTDLFSRNELIVPLEAEGVKLMSFGFVPTAPGSSGAAIMRGPMVTQVINQLLTGTDWGELDYLVIDMPPGTGDIQLTLTQLIPLTAAIIVTTPQELSFVDVVKGIQMFQKLKVPTIAVVENMAFYECGQCGHRDYLFGPGVRNRIVEQFGIHNAFEIPLWSALSQSGDAGRPVLLEQPDHVVSQTFVALARAADEEINRLQTGGANPIARFVIGRGVVLTWPDGREQDIDPATLRRRCQCARCIDENTGQPLLDPESVPDDIYPTELHPMGNYAVAVQWSDGHDASIYPYDFLATLAAPAVG